MTAEEIGEFDYMRTYLRSVGEENYYKARQTSLNGLIDNHIS